MATGTLTRVAARRQGRLHALYHRYEAVLLGVLGLVLPILAWEAAAQAGWINPVIFSSPSAIARAFEGQLASGVLIRDVTVSLREFLVSFVLAVVVGIPLGILMGMSENARYAMEPYIWFFYTVPSVAFYSLLIVWLGFGFWTVVAISFWLTVIPVTVNTLAGVRSTDAQLVRVIRAFGGRTRDVVLKAVLPSAVPLITAGLRIGLGRALVGVIVGELFSSNAGVGYRISYYAGMLQMANMFVPLVCVVVFGVALSQGARWAETQLMRRWGFRD